LFVTVVINTFEDRVVIQVTDEGKGFNSKAVPDPTHVDNVIKTSGRGVFLIKSLMNTVRYTNRGRTIQMVKLLQKGRKGTMKTQTQEVNGVVIVSPDGEINISTSPQLRTTFLKMMEKPPAKMLIDCALVPFVDSSGLATLIELDQKMKKANGRLRLCNLNKKIIGIFEITKIHKLIPIFETRELALKDF